MPLMPVVKVKPGYKPQSIDTSIDADFLLFQLLRKLTPQQKNIRTINFNKEVRNLALLGIKNQNPSATFTLIKKEYIKRCLGFEWIEILLNYLSGEELMIQEPIGLAKKIAHILELLQIPYVVGGSVASSLLGENRATQDLDLVINISMSQAQPLIKAMEGEFYISEIAVIEAIEKARVCPREASFNVINLASIEKADIFVMNSDDPFSISTMNRRQSYVVSDEDETAIYIYSAEDIILQKLSWYRLSGSGLEKQWRDVLGVLKVQGERLDFNYLNEWAEVLNINDLLIPALRESGL
jgi:hypothetical protein